MATVTTSPPLPLGWRARLGEPRTALALVGAYLVVVLGVLFSLNRDDVWFLVYGMFAFPAFVLSPLIILSANIGRTLKFVIIGTLVAVVMPLLGMYDTGYLELAIQITIFTGLALGLNIV